MNRVSNTLVGIAGLAVAAWAQTTERVSTSSSGAEANWISRSASISGDGRFVAFTSFASNLVPGDTNAASDVFVYDRHSDVIEAVSVTPAGTIGNSQSGYHWYSVSISADGRYVAFSSYASDLVPNDGNGHDVFVRDRLSHTTSLTSVATNGVQANASCLYPSISGDGRFVAFVSYATNLVPGDTNGVADIFVRDLVNGVTERVSVDSNGAQSNGPSGVFNTTDSSVSISADGRFVTFSSDATNLVTGDSNGVRDIFVRDRMGGTTELVSVDSNGAQWSWISEGPSISADGRYVAFSRFYNSSSIDVFVRDRAAATTTLASVAIGGGPGNAQSQEPSISADGRYVAFLSYATNLVPNYSGFQQTFVRDIVRGATELASVDANGVVANGFSGVPAISSDGRCIAFESYATNLVAGDTNGQSDIFVRDRGLLFPGAYCTAGTTTNGCVATIAGAGAPSASSGSAFTLSVSNVEGQKLGLFFYGVDNSSFAPTPWGATSSWLCVKSPTQRTPVQSSGGTATACDGVLALDWNAFITANPSALGNPFAASQHLSAHAWFRDPPSPKTTALSDALEFVVGP